MVNFSTGPSYPMQSDWLSDHTILPRRFLHDATNVTIPNEPYYPPPYQPTAAIVRTHRLPRCGYPKNIGVLWEGNQQQIETYIIGVVINSCIIIGVMAVALIILAILRVCGYKRVGFWVGYFEYGVGAAEDADDDSLENNSDSMHDDHEDGIMHEDAESSNIIGKGATPLSGNGCMPSKNGVQDDVIGHSEHEEQDNNRSTGIAVIKTIGGGDFVERSNHVSIVIQKDATVSELPSASADMNVTTSMENQAGIHVDKPESANVNCIEDLDCLKACAGNSASHSQNNDTTGSAGNGLEDSDARDNDALEDEAVERDNSSGCNVGRGIAKAVDSTGEIPHYGTGSDVEDAQVTWNENDMEDNASGCYSEIRNVAPNNSTGITTIKTIGGGDFGGGSSNECHLMSAPNSLFCDSDVEKAQNEGNNISGHVKCAEAIDSIEQDQNVNCAESIENDTHQKTTKAARPRPKLKRIRMSVAQVDRNGKIIRLRPKPVPQELFLKVRVVRTLFICFGIGALLATGLFYSLGVKNFEVSMKNLRSAITQFNDLGYRAINVTDELLDAQQQAEKAINYTDVALHVITQSCNLESFVNAKELIEAYELAKDYFLYYSDALTRLLDGFNENMMNIINATTWLHDQTYKTNIAFAVMVLIMCVMIVLIFIMIVGVVFAVYEIENCFTCFMRRVILLPIFILQVVLATIFAAIFMIAALSGSDFCITPNLYAVQLTTKIAAGDDSLSPLFSLLIFYLSGCSYVDYESVQSLTGVINSVNLMLAVAHDMAEVFNTITPQDIFRYCNSSQIVIVYFDQLGGTMHNVTHQLHDSLLETLKILSCRSVYPVYSELVQDAGCIDAVSGVAAVFATLLSIAVLSCCMVAFRAALYPIQQSRPAVDAADSMLSEPSETDPIEMQQSKAPDPAR